MPPMGNNHRLRAVIVEGNAVSRELLRGILRNHGVEVEGEALGSEHALGLVRRLTPDLACVDIGLADGGGVSLLQAIKSERPQTRIIMVSGASQPDRVRGAMEAGADGFIVKPYSAATLFMTIARLFPALGR
jgi:two-component system chemotaxis response regulator CheY